jgi:hypothetical protein
MKFAEQMQPRRRTPAPRRRAATGSAATGQPPANRRQICSLVASLAGHVRQHRHAGRVIVAQLEQRQRPEMRRRPHEDDQEQNDASSERAGNGRPANHRRECAGRAADDDVLRRRALQPHRVDDSIEEDREGQQAAGDPVDQKCRASPPNRPTGSGRSQSASPGRPRRAGSGALRRAAHHRVDIGVVPHVERAGRPAPTAMHRSAISAITGCMLPGASIMPTNAVKTTSDMTRGFSSAK